MIDAYNISFMLKNFWAKLALPASGASNRALEVPVYVQENDELKRVVNVIEQDGKIILVKE
jgi:hypothetical protein